MTCHRLSWRRILCVSTPYGWITEKCRTRDVETCHRRVSPSGGANQAIRPPAALRASRRRRANGTSLQSANNLNECSSVAVETHNMRLHPARASIDYAPPVGETHIMRLYIPGTDINGYGDDNVETRQAASLHWGGVTKEGGLSPQLSSHAWQPLDGDAGE